MFGCLSSSRSHSIIAFELIHCDVWTSPVASASGCRYYLVLLDDYTHFCWTFPMVHKSEVADHIINFFAYARTQFRLPIKNIQADNGTEFVNKTLTCFLTAQGTHLRLSCLYTSPQNGKAERVLRTLNNVTRTLLIHSHMAASYWAENLATTTYLLNRRPCSAIQHAVPFQFLHGKPPDYTYLRVFGCLCYPNLSATAPHKLAPRSTACVFLGYPSSHKRYRCLDLSTRRVIISRHVVFDESSFPFSSESPPLSQLDFLLSSPSSSATASPSVAPSTDVEQPRPSPLVLQELPKDDPAIIMRGPVLHSVPLSRPAGLGATAPPPCLRSSRP
jgi:histone deacetylase 1/2